MRVSVEDEERLAVCRDQIIRIVIAWVGDEERLAVCMDQIRRIGYLKGGEMRESTW